MGMTFEIHWNDWRIGWRWQPWTDYPWLLCFGPLQLLFRFRAPQGLTRELIDDLLYETRKELSPLRLKQVVDDLESQAQVLATFTE